MGESERLTALRKSIGEAQKEREFREGRLLSAERMVKYLNVYYACFAAAAAILSLVYPTPGYQALSVMMTVMLALMVVFLCAQKYAVRAQRMHAECTALQSLYYDAENALSDEDIRRLQGRYMELTGAGEGCEGHERRAVLRMHDREEKRLAMQEGRTADAPRLYGYEKFLYWFAEIAGIVLKVVLLLAPVAGIVLAAVGLI